LLPGAETSLRFEGGASGVRGSQKERAWLNPPGFVQALLGVFGLHGSTAAEADAAG
jgi:hypothetical protein